MEEKQIEAKDEKEVFSFFEEKPVQPNAISRIIIWDENDESDQNSEGQRPKSVRKIEIHGAQQKDDQQKEQEKIQTNNLRLKNRHSNLKLKKKVLFTESDQGSDPQKIQSNLDSQNETISRQVSKVLVFEEDEEKEKDQKKRRAERRVIFEEQLENEREEGEKQESQILYDIITPVVHKKIGQKNNVRLEAQKDHRQKQGKQKQKVEFSNLVSSLTEQQIKQFIYRALSPSQNLVSRIKKVQSMFEEKYQLYIEDMHDPFLYCERKNGFGAKYYVSRSKVIDKRSPSFIGRIIGNPIGSKYHIQTKGQSPKKSINRKDWRAILGKVQYETNLFGMNGPRRVKVFLPIIQSKEEIDCYKIKPKQQDQILGSSLTKIFKNKEPKWIQRYRCFGLNFGGGVKQASVKNFILKEDQVNESECQQEQDKSELIFGKVDKFNYHLQINHPFSIFQAFCIAVTQFDFKIHCQ